MKGKKFDAAEKHFIKKQEQYEKEIKNLYQMLKDSQRETSLLKGKYESAQSENEQLKAWIERLLEYTELSKEDIRLACEKDKKMSKATDLLLKFSSFMPY